jgi:hypothetical protein
LFATRTSRHLFQGNQLHMLLAAVVTCNTHRIRLDLASTGPQC